MPIGPIKNGINIIRVGIGFTVNERAKCCLNITCQLEQRSLGLRKYNGIVFVRKVYPHSAYRVLKKRDASVLIHTIVERCPVSIDFTAQIL